MPYFDRFVVALSISCVIFSVIYICMYVFSEPLFVFGFALPFWVPCSYYFSISLSCQCVSVIESWLLIK